MIITERTSNIEEVGMNEKQLEEQLLEQKFLQRLLDEGIISKIPPRWNEDDEDDDFEPIEIEGEPLLVEGGGGATTGSTYDIYIVPHGTPFKEKSELFGGANVVFSANRRGNLEIRWREPKFLEIRFDKAQISGFKNYWRGSSFYVVEIRLVPLDEKSSLFDSDKSETRTK